jgi:hypothetical protein
VGSVISEEVAMAERKDPMRDRELSRRRENEQKDLEVESRHGQRPLEGLSSSGAGTTWTPDQDEREAQRVHGNDEERSRDAPRQQIPEHPGDPLPEG